MHFSAVKKSAGKKLSVLFSLSSVSHRSDFRCLFKLCKVSALFERVSFWCDLKKKKKKDLFTFSCLSNLIFKKDLEWQKYIYTKGCVGQFEKWLQDNLIIVAGIFVGIALLQVRSLFYLHLYEEICLCKTNKLMGSEFVWSLPSSG